MLCRNTNGHRNTCRNQWHLYLLSCMRNIWIFLRNIHDYLTWSTLSYVCKVYPLTIIFASVTEYFFESNGIVWHYGMQKFFSELLPVFLLTKTPLTGLLNIECYVKYTSHSRWQWRLILPFSFEAFYHFWGRGVCISASLPEPDMKRCQWVI